MPYLHTRLAYIFATALLTVAAAWSPIAIAAEDPSPTIERVPVNLIRLKTTAPMRLDSKDGRKITHVDGFDPAVCTVTAVSATALRLNGAKAGFTEMSVTYDNQQVERFAVVVLTDEGK